MLLIVNLKQKLFIAGAVAILAAMLMVIGFGNRGWVDRQRLLAEKQRLLEQNEDLVDQNIALSREIARLKHDLQFVEDVARRELGMIGKNEVIVRFKNAAEPAAPADAAGPPASATKDSR
jgi:cell division protein FtsB